MDDVCFVSSMPATSAANSPLGTSTRTEATMTWLKLLLQRMKPQARAEQALASALGAELQTLQRYFPAGAGMQAMLNTTAYPRCNALGEYGIHAYHFSIMPNAASLERLLALVDTHGFKSSISKAGEWALCSNAEGLTLALHRQAEFGSSSLILVSNDTGLLNDLCAAHLQPPAPWEVFPGCDPGSIGSLQGSTEYWWHNYWLPFWSSLGPQQRNAYLARHSVDGDWLQFIETH